MSDTLEALLRLQEVEAKFAVLRRRRDSKTRRVEQQQRLLRQTEDKLLQSHRSCQEQQIKLDALSLEVASIEETVSKHREALNRAKTNKEYAAILTAMNTEKADNAKRESGILEYMEQIQTAKQEAAQVEVERSGYIESVESAEKGLAKLDNDTKDEIEKLLAARAKLAENVPPTTLSTFLRIAEHHDGEAMAQVIRVHPKRPEYACEGCNMTVSLEVVSTLTSRADLQPCKSCGRILYLEQAAAAS